MVKSPNIGPGYDNEKPPETPENSEYYMLCHGWNAAHLVDVTLEGTTDARGEFNYHMNFDIETGKFQSF